MTHFGSDLKRFQPREAFTFKSSQLDCENLFLRYKLEKRLRFTLTLNCLVGDWKRRRWLQRITREQFVRRVSLTNEFTRLPWSCYLRLGGRPANYSCEMRWTRVQLQSFKTGVLIERSCLISKRGSNYHSMKFSHRSCYLRLGGRPAKHSWEMRLCQDADAEFLNYEILIKCSCLISKLRGSNNSLIDHVTCAWVAVVNYLCEMHLDSNAVA